MSECPEVVYPEVVDLSVLRAQEKAHSIELTPVLVQQPQQAGRVRSARSRVIQEYRVDIDIRVAGRLLHRECPPQVRSRLVPDETIARSVYSNSQRPLTPRDENGPWKTALNAVDEPAAPTAKQGHACRASGGG